MVYTTEPLVYRRVHRDNLSGNEIMELDRALNVLRGLVRKLHFAEAERRTLRQRIRVHEARLHVEYGKQGLRAGDLTMAAACFAKAAARSRDVKIHVTNGALRFCPGLIRRLYLLKTRRHATPPPQVAAT